MSAAVEPISILQPVSEEAENRKQEAKKHWSIICKSGGLVSVNSLKIGFHAYALKKDNLFGILGFENEKEAWEASGVGDSTWYANIRLAEQFTGVSEELFCGMKQANARALADLPESKRFTEYWLRRAATDPIELFKKMIDEEMDGLARASDGKERTTTFKQSMPASRKKAVEAGIKEYAKEIGEQDEGRALELMVAEHTGGTSLIGAITTAIDRIDRIQDLRATLLSAEEVLEKTYEELGAIVGLFKSALQSVQNLE